MSRRIDNCGRLCLAKHLTSIASVAPCKYESQIRKHVLQIFVQISCPQGLVLDSKEFYSPVVTPHEVRTPQCSEDRGCAFSVLAADSPACHVNSFIRQAFVAFTGRDWDASKYRLDFQDLLQPADVHTGDPLLLPSFLTRFTLESVIGLVHHCTYGTLQQGQCINHMQLGCHLLSLQWKMDRHISLILDDA